VAKKHFLPNRHHIKQKSARRTPGSASSRQLSRQPLRQMHRSQDLDPKSTTPVAKRCDHIAPTSRKNASLKMRLVGLFLHIRRYIGLLARRATSSQKLIFLMISHYQKRRGEALALHATDRGFLPDARSGLSGSFREFQGHEWRRSKGLRRNNPQ
jgi:hypothetical protein